LAKSVKPAECRALNEYSSLEWHLAGLMSKSKAPFTRYNLLSNRFDNLLNVCIHDTTSCQYNWLYRVFSWLSTGCTTRFDNRLNEQWLFVEPGWMNSGCSFNTVVKPVWQLVWQPVGCLFTRYSRLSNWLY